MKSNQLILSLVIAGGALMASGAFAENYGMAGCGLGSMAFEHQNGKEQIIAATLNGTGEQTFGITTGTSNCTDDSHTASAMYIAVNKESLKKDIARGNGESLNGLSQILKCGDSSTLGATLQKNYAEIFPSETVKSEDVNKNIQMTIKNNANLKSSCHASL